ncbi:MAG: Bro-N domain-containing protein, partial [Candidatus Paraprevotella stercoravium]|nr:Bro-N domain-containing protein [Candidatus Paraprevotella stercoravium]
MKELANQQAAHLQVFYNESENVSIRTKVIAGEPWFVGKDVCNLLGIANTKDALSRLDDDERRGVGITDPIGRNQQVNCINESGLYHLIFISRKPEAKAIRRWVTGTVLPSIRRTGSYTVGGQQEGHKRLPLPKFRPYFKEWKERLTPYIRRNELGKTAVAERVTLEHVMKVWAGTSVSRRVAERITAIA